MAALSREFRNHEGHLGAKHSHHKEDRTRKHRYEQPLRIALGHESVTEEDQGRHAAEVAGRFPKTLSLAMQAAHLGLEDETVQHLDDAETDGNQN